jgi:hypothetical protein
MHIDLDLPSHRQRLFLDHFNSALRSVSTSTSGSAGFREDGTFESSVTADFPVGEEKIVLTWTMTKSEDGSLQSIDMTSVDPVKEETIWKDAVYDFVTSVLSAALVDRQYPFFHRRLFNYIGTQLDGEYWLPGYRLAPAYPDDPEPQLFGVERILAIDMNVKAIDEHSAHAIADEMAKRHAARLSLLLNVGLYQTQPEFRWVILKTEEGEGFDSERYQLGFSKSDMYIDRMPKKGEICSLGKYAGSLEARYHIGGQLLSLPPETRKILRGIEHSTPHIREAFDCCARLYQVAAVVGTQYPSVGLAYRIAAVEAITQGSSEFKGFSDFVRSNVRDRPGLDQALDFLWGSIRSAHFHRGKFPMGEYEARRLFDPLMDSDVVETQYLQRFGYEVTREAILTWLTNVVPELQAEDDPAA